MLEEFHSKVLHLVGKDNDATDDLSRLDTTDNSDNEMETELVVILPLTYQAEVQ